MYGIRTTRFIAVLLTIFVACFLISIVVTATDSEAADYPVPDGVSTATPQTWERTTRTTCSFGVQERYTVKTYYPNNAGGHDVYSAVSGWSVPLRPAPASYNCGASYALPYAGTGVTQDQLYTRLLAAEKRVKELEAAANKRAVKPTRAPIRVNGRLFGCTKAGC